MVRTRPGTDMLGETEVETRPTIKESTEQETEGQGED